MIKGDFVVPPQLVSFLTIRTATFQYLLKAPRTWNYQIYHCSVKIKHIIVTHQIIYQLETDSKINFQKSRQGSGKKGGGKGKETSPITLHFHPCFASSSFSKYQIIKLFYHGKIRLLPSKRFHTVPPPPEKLKHVKEP